ncbi:MAG: hypothetical protein H7289_10385 [Mucilaginibacter sp.]|nr:hypothetical protein [Mucilaginibacter sp.]
MTIHFFNRDFSNARFGITWGDDNKTQAIALKPGDGAALDLDLLSVIPDGATCGLYISDNGCRFFKQMANKFKYTKGRGFGGTFDFYMRGKTPALSHYPY